MRKDAYSRTVLITGGAGFIGSNYLNTVVAKYPEYHFVNVDALTYAANLDNIEISNAPNYSFEKTDIRDKTTLRRVFESHRPTHIIHFAAESHVDISIKNPDIFIETNIVGTHNLLLLAKEFSVKRFLFISTDEVYGSLSVDAQSSQEQDVLAPSSPYSASKAAAEMLVRSYHETFGLDIVITRSSNNYGPYQHGEKFIPTLIRSLLTGSRVPIYGTGENIRNWIHVDDNVAGIDCVFHNGEDGEIYNLGGPSELSNIEVVRMVLALLEKDESSIQYVTDRLGHDFRYSLDSSKARRELKWEPLISLEDGLKRTVQDYKRQFSV